MKRKLAVLTAAIIGLSTTAFTTVLPQEFNAFTEIDASALTIIAEIKELSLEKDTIEIGETTHLNAKFDSGITDNAECGSSNSSVVKVVSGSVKDGWEIEGIGEGTAKILVHNGIYEKSVEITVTSTQSTEEPIPVPTEKTVFVEPGCYIDVVSQPNKTVYNIGDTLDLAGLKVDVMFASGGEKPISQINNDWRKVIDSENPLENENFIVDTSEFDSSKAGEYNIKVSLTDDAMSYKWWYCQSIDIPVTVVENDTIKGDVNADGNFTVADVVMLQKWLLAVPDVTLTNWKAADLCEDGELNVFDLCMMKRGLINQGQYSDEPVLLIDDSRIYKTETGYDDNPYTRLITADGDMYSKRVCDCAYLSFEDHMNHVKAEGEKENHITDAEVLKKITEFSKNAAQYKDCKMKTADDYKVVDYGQIDLSVLYRDENGELQLLRLYGYGENPMILDNPEVKDFVKLLIEKDHIDGLAFWEEEIPVDYPNITMNDIIIFVEKGSDMRLADLEGFECVDIGAGNHTFLYDTADGRFRLSIGSANGKDIGYAKLECFESGEIIDISKESVEEFYNKNTFIAEKDIVMPDVEVEYGMPFGIRGGDSGLYAAPSTDAPVSAYIPKWNMLHEIGYQEGNNDWIFTEYNGIKGWVRVKDDKDNSNLEYMAAPAKPVIYLYPEQETDVNVELDLKNATLSTTYPKYKNGWDVTAMPDGTLINKVDGTKHSYLFWDACNDSTRYDFSKGFCVAGEDTEAFLKEKLTYMGLNEQEMNEFIVYWLPLMEHNAYNLISFQTDAYTDNAKLNITPNPDSLLRIFMTYIPLDEAVEIAPQQLETFERKGFTVVEWGGTKIG